MTKRKAMHGLGELQAEVMEIVWDKGQATVADVVELISRRRPVTYTTVLVAMQKLRQKGWLKHKSEGRAYVYSPRRTREQVHSGLLKDFLRSAFRGDARLLLSNLLDAHPLSAQELEDLRRLIEQRKKELGRESAH
jgi:predicted transcriptional regulator